MNLWMKNLHPSQCDLLLWAHENGTTNCNKQVLGRLWLDQLFFHDLFRLLAINLIDQPYTFFAHEYFQSALIYVLLLIPPSVIVSHFFVW
jgi:glycosidase